MFVLKVSAFPAFINNFYIEKILSDQTFCLLLKSSYKRKLFIHSLYTLLIYPFIKKVNTSEFFILKASDHLSGQYDGFKLSTWYLYSSSWKAAVWYSFRSILRGFKSKIKLIGLRYRILAVKGKQRCAWVTMGFSHYIFMQLGASAAIIRRYKKRKYTLFLKSLDYVTFFQFLFLLRRFRGPNVFTGNGVRMYGEKLFFKPRLRMK